MSLGILAVIEKKLQSIDKSKVSIEGFDKILKTVQDTINIINEFDKPDYDAKIKLDLKSKINELNEQTFKVINSFTGKGNELTPYEKEAFSVLLAAKTPMEMLTEKRDLMNDKESIEKVLCDFSFASDYFGPRPEVKNPEEYKSGNINFDDGDIEQAMRRYRAGKYEFTSNLTDALKSLSKDKINPAATFSQKLQFLDLMLNEMGIMKKPLSAIDMTYQRMNKIAEGKIQDLRNMSLFSSNFFNETLGFGMDSTYINSGIEKLDIDENSKDVLKQIASDLKPYYKKKIKSGDKEITEKHYVGLNDALFESFDVSSRLLQAFYGPVQLMGDDSNAADLIGEGKPFHDIHRLYKDFNQRIIACINRDEGAKIPTKQELSQFIKDAGNALNSIDEQALFNHRNGGITTAAMSYLGTFHQLEMICPGLKDEIQPVINGFGERLHDAYRNERSIALASAPASKRQMEMVDNMLEGFKDLYYQDVISEDEYYRTVLTKMAENPAYCEHVMTKLNKDLELMIDAEKQGANNYCSSKIISTDKDKFYSSSENGDSARLPAERRNESFYRLYLAGKQLQHEQRKIEDFGKTKASFSDKVQGKVNPEILNLRKFQSYNDANLKGINKYLDNILTSKAFKELHYIKPSEFADASKTQEGMLNIIKLGSERRAGAVDAKLDPESPETGKKKERLEVRAEGVEKMNSFFNGLDKETLDVLSQNSSVFFKKNSPEYTAIGDAIAKINTAKESGTGPDINAYKDLYKACSVYMLSHDSNPTTKIGKQRFNAAAKIAANLSVHIEDTLNKTDKQNVMRETADLNMIRSKVFRNEYEKASKASLKELLVSPKAYTARIKELTEYRRNVKAKAEQIEQSIKSSSVKIPTGPLNTEEKLSEFKTKTESIIPKIEKAPEEPRLSNINIF